MNAENERQAWRSRAEPAACVAVLGTGIMGAGMARSLRRSGLRVQAWNRSPGKAEPLAAEGVQVSSTAADAVRGADVIVTMLTDAPAVRECVELASPGLTEGQLWLQTSTVGAAAVPGLAALADEAHLVLIDAPVLGTRLPAEQGQLLVFAAGPEEVRPVLAPVLEAIAARTVWLGADAGAGTATRLKMVINSWVLTLVSGVAEAVSLAEGLGLDPRLFVDTVSGGGLDSPYLQGKAAAMLRKDYTADFGLGTAAKDARLIVQDAVGAGLRLDVLSAVAGRFGRALEQGHSEKDLAATYFASFEDWTAATTPEIRTRGTHVPHRCRLRHPR